MDSERGGERDLEIRLKVFKYYLQFNAFFTHTAMIHRILPNQFKLMKLQVLKMYILKHDIATLNDRLNIQGLNKLLMDAC